MRDELKEREAELEKSVEDKQQLKNQMQNLKAGLQNLQIKNKLQVRRKHTHTDMQSQEKGPCVHVHVFVSDCT